MIAIIPARGGSKRVKRKNLTMVNGKPLLGHAVDVAIQSRLFQDVYVNSEDQEILTCASEHGAIAYERPGKLGGDKVFLIDVIKEMITSMNLSPETEIAVLLPTCPLRTAEDLKEAYKLFLCHNRQFPVCSVTTYETPIHLGLILDQNERLTPRFPDDYHRSTRSTDHPTVYKFNEAIVINSVAQWLTQTNLIGKQPIPYVMPPERSIAIDYPYQLQHIQLLLALKEDK